MTKQANWTKVSPTALDHAKAAVALLRKAGKCPDEAPELLSQAIRALSDASDHAMVEQSAAYRAREETRAWIVNDLREALEQSERADLLASYYLNRGDDRNAVEIAVLEAAERYLESLGGEPATREEISSVAREYARQACESWFGEEALTDADRMAQAVYHRPLWYGPVEQSMCEQSHNCFESYRWVWRGAREDIGNGHTELVKGCSDCDREEPTEEVRS